MGAPDPSYTIDLDLPPLERWSQIMADKGEILHDFAYKFRNKMNLSQEQMDQFVTYGKYFPDFAANVEAIGILSKVDLPTLYTFNFMYDLQFFGCTSVIIRQPDGKLFHGRNLDYNYQEEISAIATQINWVRGGKLIYISETLVGFVSLITVTKVGQYSVSINYRSNPNSKLSVEALLEKHYIQSINLPQLVVNTADTYEQAVEMFKTINVSSPIYFIVSGIEGNQGTVIERDRESYLNIYNLDDSNWFLVQTNNDRHKLLDARYKSTLNAINNIGQNECTKQVLLDQVMSVNPTRNIETISTSIYSAYDGQFISWNYLLNSSNNNIQEVEESSNREKKEEEQSQQQQQQQQEQQQ